MDELGMDALPAGYTAREMYTGDLRGALALVSQDDPGEVAEAKQVFKESVDDHWVIEHDTDGVVGLTGLLPADMTADACWLSWTVIDDAHRGEALARGMLVALAQRAADMGVRKVFVRLGTDDRPLTGSMPSGVDLNPFLDAGFVEECRMPGFYTSTEDLVTLGLDLGGEPSEPGDGDMRLARVEGVQEVEDTEGTFLLDWSFDEAAGSGVEQVEHLVEQAAKRGARLVVASVASDAGSAMDLFEAAGFYEQGRLLDYYEPGVDDVQYRLDLI